MTVEAATRTAHRPKTPPALPLALFAAVAPAVPIVSQRGMTLVFALAALAALVLHLRLGRPLLAGMRRNPAVAAAAVYLLWSTLSVGWALDSATAAVQAGQLLGGMICLALAFPVAAELSIPERRMIGFAAVAGAGLGALLLLVESYGGMQLQRLVHGFSDTPPPHMLNKALVTESLLAWPAALHLWQLGRRACAALLLCIVSVAVLPQDSQTATLALACGLAAAVATRLTGRLAPWLLALALVAGTAAMPLVLPEMRVWFWNHIDHHGWWSAHHRLYIWNFVLERIAEKPWLGWGLEASRVMPNFGWEGWPGYEQIIPLHPHNNLLQTWLELGLVGLALLLAAVLMPLHRALAMSWGQRIFAAGAWTSAVVAALPGYGAGQSWWLFTLVALGVLIRAVVIREEDP